MDVLSRAPCSLPRAAQRPAQAPTADLPEWTVLVYLNGHNNLEPDEVRNVLDMEKVGSTDQVKVAIQLARGAQKEVHPHAHHDNLDGDWAGVRRYAIGKAPAPGTNLSSHEVQELPASTDMGDPSTLADFVKWGMAKYPARHYMVVVNDHGAGFRGTSYDDLHKSHFDMPGLKNAMATVQKDTGNTPDVLLFDACEMGQTEVGYQMRKVAHFMVGSEEIVGSVGMPYSKFLEAMNENPHMAPADVAKTIVNTASDDEAMRRSEKQEDASVELSAVDLGQMTALRGACDDLSRNIRAAKVPVGVLTQAIGKTKHFNLQFKDYPGADYRDLGDFAQHLLDSPSVAEPVKQSARQLQAELQKTVIAMETKGKGQEHDTGLSVYLPLHYGDEKQPHPTDRPAPDKHWDYQHLDMSHDGDWQQLLDYIAA